MDNIRYIIFTIGDRGLYDVTTSLILKGFSRRKDPAPCEHIDNKGFFAIPLRRR